MTSVEAVFQYQGGLSAAQAQKLGESYTRLGIRKIAVNEEMHSIAIEYDATRMDRNGVASMLRGLDVPVAEPAPAAIPR